MPLTAPQSLPSASSDAATLARLERPLREVDRPPERRVVRIPHEPPQLRELQPPPPAARPRAPAWRRSALALPVLVLASWWLMEKAREAGKAVER